MATGPSQENDIGFGVRQALGLAHSDPGGTHLLCKVATVAMPCSVVVRRNDTQREAWCTLTPASYSVNVSPLPALAAKLIRLQGGPLWGQELRSLQMLAGSRTASIPPRSIPRWGMPDPHRLRLKLSIGQQTQSRASVLARNCAQGCIYSLSAAPKGENPPLQGQMSPPWPPAIFLSFQMQRSNLNLKDAPSPSLPVVTRHGLHLCLPSVPWQPKPDTGLPPGWLCTDLPTLSWRP